MTTMTRRTFAGVCLSASAASLIPGIARRAHASPGATYTNFASLGGVPNNTGFDNATILNLAISQGVRNLYIPAGVWTFLTKPNAIAHEMEIVGEGFSSTALVRRYTEFTSTNGLLTLRAGNQHVMRLGILAAANTGGGAGISFFGDNSGSPDFSVVEDVYVSQEPGSNGTWQDAVLIHGTQRNNNGLIGVRDVSLRNCQLFASTNSACRIEGGVAINIWGGGMFPAGGTTGRLQITGTAQVPSYYVSADVPYIGGLYVDNCNYVNVKAGIVAGNITNASTASDVIVLGRCTGTVSNFWTRGRHADPGIPGS
jgi:hypothetical protein